MRCQVGDVVDVSQQTIDGLSDFFDQKSKWQIGRYVVVHAAEEDGWYVVARKLKNDMTHNPRGREIEFYQSGGHINCLTSITVVDKLIN